MIQCLVIRARSQLISRTVCAPVRFAAAVGRPVPRPLTSRFFYRVVRYRDTSDSWPRREQVVLSRESTDNSVRKQLAQSVAISSDAKRARLSQEVESLSPYRRFHGRLYGRAANEEDVGKRRVYLYRCPFSPLPDRFSDKPVLFRIIYSNSDRKR